MKSDNSTNHTHINIAPGQKSLCLVALLVLITVMNDNMITYKIPTPVKVILHMMCSSKMVSRKTKLHTTKGYNKVSVRTIISLFSSRTNIVKG